MNWPGFVLALVAVLSMVGGATAFIMRSLSRRFDRLEKSLGEVRERVAKIEGRLVTPRGPRR